MRFFLLAILATTLSQSSTAARDIDAPIFDPIALKGGTYKTGVYIINLSEHALIYGKTQELLANDPHCSKLGLKSANLDDMLDYTMKVLGLLAEAGGLAPNHFASHRTLLNNIIQKEPGTTHAHWTAEVLLTNALIQHDKNWDRACIEAMAYTNGAMDIALHYRKSLLNELTSPSIEAEDSDNQVFKR